MKNIKLNSMVKTQIDLDGLLEFVLKDKEILAFKKEVQEIANSNDPVAGFIIGFKALSEVVKYLLREVGEVSTYCGISTEVFFMGEIGEGETLLFYVGDLEVTDVASLQEAIEAFSQKPYTR